MTKILRIERCRDCHPYCRSIKGAFICVHPHFMGERAFVILGNIDAGTPFECPLEDLPPSQPADAADEEKRCGACGELVDKGNIMRLLLNCLLWVTQKLHMKMGGTVSYTKDSVILHAPKGRHFWVPTKYNVDVMRG